MLIYTSTELNTFINDFMVFNKLTNNISTETDRLSITNIIKPLSLMLVTDFNNIEDVKKLAFYTLFLKYSKLANSEYYYATRIINSDFVIFINQFNKYGLVINSYNDLNSILSKYCVIKENFYSVLEMQIESFFIKEIELPFKKFLNDDELISLIKTQNFSNTSYDEVRNALTLFLKNKENIKSIDTNALKNRYLTNLLKVKNNCRIRTMLQINSDDITFEYITKLYDEVIADSELDEYSKVYIWLIIERFKLIFKQK